ncbi:MAG: amidohydrolase family protein, partial [SAR202 cluster bacterium]|nr:amidohydrolase family protein [SAR202 cluster bacterium]
GGGVVGERESVGVEEAVRAWTLGGSYVGLQDGLLGSVQVGKAGDLVVVEGELGERGARVGMVVLGGEVV